MDKLNRTCKDPYNPNDYLNKVQQPIGSDKENSAVKSFEVYPNLEHKHQVYISPVKRTPLADLPIEANERSPYAVEYLKCMKSVKSPPK